MTLEPVRQTFVLVGGRGTRLGELTRTLSKPLIAIDEKTAFLDLLLEQIARQGFTDVVLLAGHFGDQVYDRYHGRQFGTSLVRVIREEEPSGTAGALVAAREIAAPQFMMLNGDTFFDINLRALSTEFIPAQAEALIALHSVSDPSRYGAVVLDGNQVAHFLEKQQTVGSALVSAGIYLLRASVIDRIRALPCSIETEIFPVLARERLLQGRVCEGYFVDIGLPESLEQAQRDLPAVTFRPAAFLDRDGILNVDYGYVHRPDQVEWIPGAQRAVRRLNDLGYRVVVVSNQAGIAHGYYDEACVHSLYAWMQDQLASQGAFIDAFYFCPYHPEGRIAEYRKDHADRKPGPGMILRAMADLRIDRERSFLIGDKDTDLEAARRGGIRAALFGGANLAEFLDELLREFGLSSKDEIEDARSNRLRFGRRPVIAHEQ